ncbi:MAG: hypothetical protein IJB74_06535 [Clostridia bacterium]|nr:hypothetical protein [Clostridia bacterium]
MKKSMLIHHDFIHTFRLLTYEELGRLIMAAMEFDVDGTVTEFDDRMMNATYFRLTECLRRNSEKYEEITQKRTEAAKKRWEQFKKEELKNNYDL